jgi:hypothetical protein
MVTPKHRPIASSTDGKPQPREFASPAPTHRGVLNGNGAAMILPVQTFGAATAECNGLRLMMQRNNGR